MAHKYKIGDRVVYHAVHFGNSELDGRTGTIVMIDDTGCPYTVRLDEPYAFSVRDTRIKGYTKNHGRLWWCQEANLSLLEESQTNQDIQDEMEKEEMEIHKWTDEEVEKLKEFVRAGRSRTEMAAYFGVSAESVDNKIYKLRKEDPTLPGGYRKKEHTEEKSSAAPEQEGELNELEQAMSEIITEKENEIDKLNGDIKDLQDKLQESQLLNEELGVQNRALSDKVNDLEGELRDTLDALNMTETRLDEELKNLVEKNKQLEMTQNSHVQVVATIGKENARLTRMVLKLVEQLLGGDEEL